MIDGKTSEPSPVLKLPSPAHLWLRGSQQPALGNFPYLFFGQALLFCKPTSLTPKNTLFPPLPAPDDSWLIDLPQHLNALLNASNKFFR